MRDSQLGADQAGFRDFVQQDLEQIPGAIR